ncbi:GGDEF domain-containing protein [Pseudobacteriovorax antillogorgiicola]|uniref:diguanylate cyclase n=1 Tax=Pseudobacteriovorax antillogorgiicola TaxID=1513793 RepID=A0A1Y6CTL8_9BACT|nr:GGDEF domain-containing protein [Pseudobacteriovorax antillogorgiicola]TCS45032.1 diguanylate cyclase (GGDEF)-like protein [Pseudobacteriovorax antillogorgiicola]SMF76180.1 diguanylate cyclase (GGDEF) domain-containing protein [Pseudobacteriovorax antillogorgiicola]
MKALGNKIVQIYVFAALLPLIVYLIPTLASKLFVSKGIMSFLSDIPYIGFLAVGFLGYRLNQTRILFSSGFLFISYLILQHIHTGELELDGLNNHSLIKMLAIGTPVAILVMFLQKETRLKDWRSLGRFALAMGPFFLFAILYRWLPETFESTVNFSIIQVPWLSIPQFALLSYLALLSGLYWISDQKIGLYVIAMMIAMFPCLTAYQISLMEGVEQRNMIANTIFAFSVVCGILVDAMFRMYWQRVYLDELTGIPNRRALDEYLYTLDGEYSIAMVDIDYFKKFNDAYGHDEGDNVLRLVAKTLYHEAKMRIYRYGGEEFCAVFEGVDSEDSYMFANKMRRLVHNKKFYIRSEEDEPVKRNLLSLHLSQKKPRYSAMKADDNPEEKEEAKKAAAKKAAKKKASKSNGLKVYEETTDDGGVEQFLRISVSIGLASPTPDYSNPFEVIKLADQALYKAKEQGRNCVVIANKPNPVASSRDQDSAS